MGGKYYPAVIPNCLCDLTFRAIQLLAAVLFQGHTMNADKSCKELKVKLLETIRKEGCKHSAMSDVKGREFPKNIFDQWN